MRIRVRILTTAVVAAAGVGVLAAPAFAAKPTQAQVDAAANTLKRNLGTESAKHCIDELAGGGTTSVDDCQKAPTPLKPANNEILWGAVSFAVLLIAMWKCGVPAVRNMEKAREDRIRTDLETAEHAKNEAETSLTQYRRRSPTPRPRPAIIDEARVRPPTRCARTSMARAEADAQRDPRHGRRKTSASRRRGRWPTCSARSPRSVDRARREASSSATSTATRSSQLIDSYIN